MARRPILGGGAAAMLFAFVVLAAPACQRGDPPADAPAPDRAAAVAEAEELHAAPVRRAEELFEGRFPGVRVLRTPDGGIAVRVRGATSIMGSNEPLYVIDGLPVTPGRGGGLTGINPADIHRIEVLRDAASTAFYGVRGANGVVLITTKR
jgi:TonB-dependent SusC/RagA subfamily outer membrane receptor